MVSETWGHTDVEKNYASNVTLVKDFYPDILAFEDEMNTLAEDSQYWEKCADFWFQVKEKPLQEMTLKQTEWLAKIEDRAVT